MKSVSGVRLFYCLFVLLLNCLSVLFTMMFVSCDSASGTGSPDTSDPCTNCSLFDATQSDSNDSTHADSEDPTGNDTIHIDTVDPLADYYWLEGQWKRESVDGIPSGILVDVTVEAWDDDLGAEVHGFSPITISHFKKSTKTNEFVLFYEYENGIYAEGMADQNTLTFEFDYHLENDGGIKKNIYVKL